MSTKEKTNKVAMTEEVALQELESFLSIWIKKAPKGEDAKEKYPQTLDALIDGNLIINENGEPTYKLIHPIDGEFGKSEIVFKTRLLLSTKNNLLKGVDLSKDTAKGGAILMTHMLGFDHVNELDRLHKWDIDAASEIASVFL